MKGQCHNTYVDSGNSVTDKLGDTLSYAVPVGANVMLLKNEASVTVGQDATVTGDSVKAEAEANLDGTAGTVAAGKISQTDSQPDSGCRSELCPGGQQSHRPDRRQGEGHWQGYHGQRRQQAGSPAGEGQRHVFCDQQCQCYSQS